MSILWLIILVLYGCAGGNIATLFWWLLVPMLYQDLYDVGHR